MARCPSGPCYNGAFVNNASPSNNNPLYQQSDTYFPYVNNHTGENPVYDGNRQPPISTAYNDCSNYPIDFNTSSGGVKSSKLDRIRIIKFWGDIQEWRTYWDLFESLVHNNPGLSTIEKFNYLYGSLKGEGLSPIKCLAVRAENYNMAISTLQ